jgi:hypothetical protein
MRRIREWIPPVSTAMTFLVISAASIAIVREAFQYRVPTDESPKTQTLLSSMLLGVYCLSDAKRDR